MVCDRVAILVQGRVAAQGTIDELTMESRRFEITLGGEPPPWCSEGDLRLDTDVEGRSVLVAPKVEVDGLQVLIDRLRKDEVDIASIKPVRESLEDLFMRYVKDPLTGRDLSPGAARTAPPTAGSTQS